MESILLRLTGEVGVDGVGGLWMLLRLSASRFNGAGDCLGGGCVLGGGGYVFFLSINIAAQNGLFVSFSTEERIRNEGCENWCPGWPCGLR